MGFGGETVNIGSRRMLHKQLPPNASVMIASRFATQSALATPAGLEPAVSRLEVRNVMLRDLPKTIYYVYL